MRERTVIHVETTVEVKFDAKVIAKLEDSDYHSEIEDAASKLGLKMVRSTVRFKQ